MRPNRHVRDQGFVMRAILLLLPFAMGLVLGFFLASHAIRENPVQSPLFLTSLPSGNEEEALSSIQVERMEKCSDDLLQSRKSIEELTLAIETLQSQLDHPSKIIESHLTGTSWSHSATIPSIQIADILATTIPVQKGPSSALLLTHQSIPKAQRGSHVNGKDLDSLTQRCPELVVAVVASKQCLAVVESSSDVMPFHLFRYRRDQPVVNSKSDWQSTPYVKIWAKKLPGWDRTRAIDKMLTQFFSSLEEMSNDLKPVLERIHTDNDILVMTINEGNLDLCLNFIASAIKNNVDISNLIVFGADSHTVTVLQQIGVASYSHEGLGSFPERAANRYGDLVFNKMMWLKIAPLYVVARLGYNILFQDADNVWFKNPFPMLRSMPEDTLWMDDGARTERFSPLFANTGFYYIRNNKRTSLLLQDFLFSYNVISTTASHQEVIIQRTIDHIGRYALSFRLLEKENFPSGAVYHKDKQTLMKEIRSGSHVPFVFHMCWTAGKEDKIKYFKELGWWYLAHECTVPNMIAHAGDREFIRNCSPFFLN